MMRIGRSFVGKLVIVVGFLAMCGSLYVYLLASTEAEVPLIEDRDYRVVIALADADNLVPASEVRIAGVQVGEVDKVTTGPNGARATLRIVSDGATPLHKGAVFRVGARSAVGETYIGIQDGNGAPVPSGAFFSKRAVKPSVQLRDVFASLDPRTREAVGSMLRAASKSTKGTQKAVSSVMAGLGKLGRNGYTAVDAIAAQSEDLRALAWETPTVLRALDTNEGMIATLVQNAQRLTQATAGQKTALATTVRRMPAVLDSAQGATRNLTTVAHTLAPVAGDLHEAAGPLDSALGQLPATTRDLRGLLDPLTGTLERAPATLGRVPRLDSDARELIPEAGAMLRDVNPMLAYLKPYGPELAAFFANFEGGFKMDSRGHAYVRLVPNFNDASVTSPLSKLVASYRNPLPRPGQGGEPGPYQGEYPRVARTPK